MQFDFTPLARLARVHLVGVGIDEDVHLKEPAIALGAQGVVCRAPEAARRDRRSR